MDEYPIAIGEDDPAADPFGGPYCSYAMPPTLASQDLVRGYYICTLGPGHSGPHVAHGTREVLQIHWELPPEMQVDEGL